MLSESLIGGVQTGMGVQKVAGAAGPRGWNVFPGVGGAGGRACFYYPRLQAAASTSEEQREIEMPLFSSMLHAKLRAMPSVDPNDGETVLC